MGGDPEREDYVSRAGSAQWLDADGTWHSSPCPWDTENHSDDGEAGDGDNGYDDEIGDQASEWPEDAAADETNEAEWPEATEAAEWPQATEADDAVWVTTEADDAEWPEGTEVADDAEWEATEAYDDAEWPEATEAADEAEWSAEATEAAGADQAAILDEQAQWPGATEAAEEQAFDEHAERPGATDQVANEKAFDEHAEWPGATEAADVKAIDEHAEWPGAAEAADEKAFDEHAEWAEAAEAADETAFDEPAEGAEEAEAAEEKAFDEHAESKAEAAATEAAEKVDEWGGASDDQGEWPDEKANDGHDTWPTWPKVAITNVTADYPSQSDKDRLDMFWAKYKTNKELHRLSEKPNFVHRAPQPELLIIHRSLPPATRVLRIRMCYRRPSRTLG